MNNTLQKVTRNYACTHYDTFFLVRQGAATFHHTVRGQKKKIDRTSVRACTEFAHVQMM